MQLEENFQNDIKDICRSIFDTLKAVNPRIHSILFKYEKDSKTIDVGYYRYNSFKSAYYIGYIEWMVENGKCNKSALDDLESHPTHYTLSERVKELEPLAQSCFERATSNQSITKGKKNFFIKYSKGIDEVLIAKSCTNMNHQLLFNPF